MSDEEQAASNWRVGDKVVVFSSVQVKWSGWFSKEGIIIEIVPPGNSPLSRGLRGGPSSDSATRYVVDVGNGCALIRRGSQMKNVTNDRR